MSIRLASGVRVAALIRLAAIDGGTGAVLARGAAEAGGILLVLAQRGEIKRIVERTHDMDDRETWRDTAKQVIDNKENIVDYLARRQQRDGDLWALELDVADSERFAAETLGMN